MGYKSRSNYPNSWEHERTRIYCPTCCEFTTNATKMGLEVWVCDRCQSVCIECKEGELPNGK